ncbi:MAG: FKBP-type peptidyl-prolyl cis-trans isomerase [Mariprofundaceae bacterium]|nr:FKBP-type peptidyl-prolyl cis-trans isomerase [Mariprofundaceae bacterium]
MRIIFIMILLYSMPSIAAESTLKTDNEKLSYAIGMDIGKSIQAMKLNLDLDVFLKGVKSATEGSALMTDAEAREIRQSFFQKVQLKQADKQKIVADENLKKGEDFLAKNKTKKGVITTSSGLQYEVIKQGDGVKPSKTDQVEVHYRGTLIDGTEFDSSYKRGTPATFPVNRVIPGWTEALQLMQVGSKYKLFIPADIAYGTRQQGKLITPNSTLIFEVELLKVL